MNADELEPLQLRARQVAALMRLPFRNRSWKGANGNWQGAGSGSSLDFQDHRPYVPGDDPRYINWQAYARTGHYTMKLYRQEVSPSVDLAIDLSASMFLEHKAARTAELLYWAVECALEAGASLRCFALHGANSEPLAVETIEAHEWWRETAALEPPALGAIPWRHGSLRVLISDLLWPGDSQPVFHALDGSGGSGLLLAPYSRAEAEPDWTGNLQLHDCDSSELRMQRIESGGLQRYRQAYARHFALWQEQAMRYRIPMARIPCEGDLADALRPHVAATGAVEWKGD